MLLEHLMKTAYFLDPCTPGYTIKLQYHLGIAAGDLEHIMPHAKYEFQRLTVTASFALCNPEPTVSDAD